MSTEFEDLETIKWRHILEITSYCHCEVKLPQPQHSFPRPWYVRFIQNIHRPVSSWLL